MFLLLGNVGNEKMILGLQFLFGLVFYGFTYPKKEEGILRFYKYIEQCSIGTTTISLGFIFPPFFSFFF
jgi:hypothetical protein